jgi:DNA-binding transcriptional regulator YiaG
MNYCGCLPRRRIMTSTRIRAIRFFSRDSPQEFSQELGIPVIRICFMEAGNVEPDNSEIEKLMKQENILNLQGITYEMINEREDLYSL